MVFFLISNNKLKIQKACEIWQELGLHAEYLALSDNLYLAQTISKNKKEYIGGEGRVLHYGTFFTKSSFEVEQIFEEVNIFDFDEVESSNLFGHYVFIVPKKDTIRVITDPVGLINVYHTENNGEFFVGNDLEIIAGLSERFELSQRDVIHFALNESTSTTGTIFKNIFRLGVGCELILNGETIFSKPIYKLTSTKLNFHEYTNKITDYFQALNNYQGSIAAELSAGFDTRLVASCAASNIENIIGITNHNDFDNGVDESIGKLVASRLNINFCLIKKPPQEPKTKSRLNELLHLFVNGRNVFRSYYFPLISKQKYQKADLILGGYGGETMRAQYTKFTSLKNFVLNYYHASDIKDIETKELFISETIASLEENLSNFGPKKLGDKLNFIYTLDKMKVWGGSAVQCTLQDGDRLHPFLDWQLIGPIFSFEISELEKAKMQIKLIEFYSPNLMELPINPTRFSILAKNDKIKKGLKYILSHLTSIQRRYLITKKAKGKYAAIDGMLEHQGFSPKLRTVVNSLVQEASSHTLHLDVYGRIATVDLSITRAKDIARK